MAWKVSLLFFLWITYKINVDSSILAYSSRNLNSKLMYASSDQNHTFFVLILDEETEFPSSELNGHGPTVIGWRCKPDSTLSPKEIILRFEKPAVICRIQVLAHQYMIRELKYSIKTKPDFQITYHFVHFS